MGVQAPAVVAVLTRAPSSGGKTRLFASLGRAPDTALPRALLLDTLDAVSASGLAAVVCFSPPEAEEEVRALVPGGVQIVPQRGDDLGARMRAAFDDLLAGGVAGVVLVGSDLPLLSPDTLRAVEGWLRREPDTVCLGPATDGGYYLIGAARTPAVLFEGMRWGVPTVLEETLSRARAARIPVRLLPAAADVDTPGDLAAVMLARDAGRRTRAWARGRGGVSS